MSGLPLRPALRVALLAAMLAAIVLTAVLVHNQASGPLSPGEFDILVAARSVAGGRLLPRWAGAVHPEATGTWMGALGLAPLLWLGLPAVWAGKLASVLHFALLVGASAGLAARSAGRRAAALTAGLLCSGAPAVVAAHTHYLATTVEAAGMQLALLWWTLEARERLRWREALALGAALGTLLAYSLHTVGLALWVAAALLRRPRGLVLVTSAAALAWLPWTLRLDPTAPPQEALAILSLPLTEVVGLASLDGVRGLLQHAPRALLFGTHEIPASSPLVSRHVPWMLLLMAAPPLSLGLGKARERLLALYAIGTFAMLVVAGDLLDYPAAYRYYVPFVASAAALLGLRFAALAERLDARGPWPARALALLAAGGLAWTLPSLPGASAMEMTVPQGAFYAAQHRLSFPRRALHSHFLMLLPYVRQAELGPWLQGYGLHLGRSYARELPALEQEFVDTQHAPGARIPPPLDRRLQWTLPRTWWSVADLIEDQALRAGFFNGLGLGMGEDGRLADGDLRLLRSLAPRDRADAWRGVAVALAERAYWLRAPQSLAVDGGWPALLGIEPHAEDLLAGVGEIEGPLARRPDALLTPEAPGPLRERLRTGRVPLPSRMFPFAHPFLFRKP